jgi:hypothetical protein
MLQGFWSVASMLFFALLQISVSMLHLLWWFSLTISCDQWRFVAYITCLVISMCFEMLGSFHPSFKTVREMSWWCCICRKILLWVLFVTMIGHTRINILSWKRHWEEADWTLRCTDAYHNPSNFCSQRIKASTFIIKLSNLSNVYSISFSKNFS